MRFRPPPGMPSSPHMYLYFYRHGNSADNYRDAVLSSIAIGGKYLGAITCERGHLVREGAPSFVAPLEFAGWKKLRRMLDDMDVLVSKTFVQASSTIPPDDVEILAWGNGVIELWLGGEAISAYLKGQEGADKRTWDTGLAIYRGFCRFVDEFSPDYATIATEGLPLEPPEWLIGEQEWDWSHDYFSSFYISDRLGLVDWLEPCVGAYVERLSEGWYVSGSELFNPDRVHIDRFDAWGTLPRQIQDAARNKGWIRIN